MKKTLKTLSILVAVSMIAAFAAGCGQRVDDSGQKTDEAKQIEKDDQNKDSAEDAQNEKLEKVNLTLLMAGDEPPEQQLVLDKISELEKDKLNFTLDVVYFPWSDYQEQVKIMSAGGDEFDMYLDFLHNLAPAVSRKQCIPLNNLIDQYGDNIKKVIPEFEFESLTIDGNIYGIPALYPRAELGNAIMIRKDLREKYGIPEITNLKIFEQFLDAVKTNEPNMIPFGTSNGQIYSQLCREIHSGNIWYGFGFDKVLQVDIYNEPYRVVNFYKTEGFKKLMNWCRGAYEKGWFEKDVLTQKDDMGFFISGKSASRPSDLFQILSIEPQLKKAFPEAEIELVVFQNDKPLLSSPTNNYTSISSFSKNPERAMMFLDWLLKNQENYDLYMYGINGQHYTLEGELIKLPEGTDPAARPYNPTPWFIYNLKYHRSLVSDPPEYTEAMNYWKSAEKRSNPMASFSYSTENVKVETAQIEKIVKEIGYPVMLGVMSTDDDYQKLLDELDRAGMDKVIEDAQKQVDAYLAAKKK